MFVGVALGVILSQVTVLAIWAALGRSPIMWRAIVALTGSSLLALALCITIGEMEAEWFVLVWILVLVIVAGFLVLRWFRFHLVNINQSSNIPPGEMQFSLFQMMVLLTVTAILAAVGNVLAPRMATLGTILFGLAIAIGSALLTLASVWAALGAANVPKRLWALVPLTISVAALVFYVMETTKTDPGFVWAIVILVYVTATTATLLTARSLGLRMLRSSA